MERHAVDRTGSGRYNHDMAQSGLRRRKKQAQDARWRRMRPVERLKIAAAITAAGATLRAAGLERLGFTPKEIAAVSRSRGH